MHNIVLFKDESLVVVYQRFLRVRTKTRQYTMPL